MSPMPPSAPQNHTDQEQKNGNKGRFKTASIGIIQLVLVVVFIAGSFAFSKFLENQKEAPQVRPDTSRTLVVHTQEVTPQNYTIEFDTTGVVEARGEIGIVPQVSGRVVDIHDNFYTGGAFQKGDTLFTIELKDFELDVERLKAEVAQAQTAYNLQQAEADAALQDWKQLRGDQEVPDLVARKPQMAEALANLNAAKASLATARLNLDRATFELPFDGRVVSSSLELGQYVSSTQNYGSVYNIETLEVQSSLKDSELQWLLEAEAPEIKITTNYLGKERSYDASLNRGAAALDRLTRFASVNFGFESPPEFIIPGLFVDVQVKGAVLPDVYKIPSDALQKDNVVWGVTPDKTLTRIEGKTVYSADDHIVIMLDADKPLQVVTDKIPGAVDGGAVRLADDNEQPQSEQSQTDGSGTIDE